MESKNSQAVTFGVFHLDFAKGRLSKFGTPVRLKPQPLKLLLLLVQRPGEVVSGEEIQQQLWGDSNTFVDFDLGLNHCIRQIRAVLGDDAASPRYVETVPRTGYRFIAPVTQVPAQVEASSAPVRPADSHPVSPEAKTHRGIAFWSAAVLAILFVIVSIVVIASRSRAHEAKLRPASNRIMLAVLPFENLTGDPQQEYLSDGVTDELIMHLSRFSPGYLGVISRTSSMKYKGAAKGVDQISRELGVSYLLEGSIKRNGKKLHVSAELIQASDQTHLWAESYDSDVTGEQILAMEEEVASRIARSLSIVLPQTHNRRSSTANAAAYDDYLKGRYYWNRRTEEGFNQAIDYFQQAIAIDPAYAEPYAGLADSYNLFIEYFDVGSTTEFAQRSEQAAQKAVELDDTLAEGHAALGFNLWRYQWDFSAAEREFRKALDVDPNYANAHHWYGLYLASRGRFGEGRTELSQARALDPLSLIIMTNAGWIDYFARDSDAAITKYREATSISPDFVPAVVKLSWAYEEKQMWKEAADSRERFYRAAGYPSVSEQIQRAYSDAGYPGALKFLLGEAAKPDRKQYYSNYEAARMNALLGNEEQALADLRRAFNNRSGWLVFLEQEPAFDVLKGEPEFQDLVRHIQR
jgi:TolB-like protein/DNA-binding winged helix-turn-helix (wHTH) protein/Tfp pilus assembly protein PilF